MVHQEYLEVLVQRFGVDAVPAEIRDGILVCPKCGDEIERACEDGVQWGYSIAVHGDIVAATYNDWSTNSCGLMVAECGHCYVPDPEYR